MIVLKGRVDDNCSAHSIILFLEDVREFGGMLTFQKMGECAGMLTFPFNLFMQTLHWYRSWSGHATSEVSLQRRPVKLSQLRNIHKRREEWLLQVNRRR